MPAPRRAPGLPIWADATSPDVDASLAFYQGLFGWTPYAPGGEYGRYVTFFHDGKPVAAVGPTWNEGERPLWKPYFQTADSGATATAVTAAGGRVLAPPIPVGDAGTLAIFADAAGAVFGTWEPGTMSGYELWGEVGSVVYTELHAGDYRLQLTFYGEVLHWATAVMSDSDAFRYTTFGPGEPGDVVGGVFDATDALPESSPGEWKIYFGTAGVAASVARVRELGGEIVREVWDSPFGRMAEVADPVGARFLLNERADVG
ncbi:VOC family protein [Gryllotalpicola ginsengisoli]|uniref:VOC family protein n=1 Tax=Gryllotalpicola ginsengisoli TaxID=444608 RepID=UPI000481FA56|nr:VOC family protein [Gryllotalpicola ginsengisoli]